MKQTTEITAGNIEQKIKNYKSAYSTLSIASMVLSTVGFMALIGIHSTSSAAWTVPLFAMTGATLTLALAVKFWKKHNKLLKK